MDKKNVTKFVVCTRKDSRRIPNKPFVKLNGKPIIEHIIERLAPILSPVFLAIPTNDLHDYIYLLKKYPNDVRIYSGSTDDPLKRMSDCCEMHGIKNAIRVTHDKIFVDEKDVFEALSVYMQRGLGYLYSSSMIDGTGFEIIHEQVLKEAANQFKGVEHISYAAKAVALNQIDYNFNHDEFRNIRLLIDFPEDVTFFQTVLSSLGNNCTREQVISFLNQNKWVQQINELPLITVYTCSYNNADSIFTTMESVAEQIAFKNNQCEYILIDDFSNDGTSFKMSEFAHVHKGKVKYFRNDENIGLASSSNKALSHARGKYIIRIDADDYFSYKDALRELAFEIMDRDLDVVYPGFYDGSMHKRGNPREHHHPAGAMFKTRALNHIKFTDKLRNYDGLDLYVRAREQLKIGYLMRPMFFYTHRQGSMSRTNLAEREKIKNEILCSGGSDC